MRVPACNHSIIKLQVLIMQALAPFRVGVHLFVVVLICAVANGFNVSSDEFERRELARSSTVYGMDVSSHQGNVDWTAAYNNGARFAYVKATEGTGYVNPYFAQQYVGSFKVGMIRGAYHFALPDKSSGTAQAIYFLAHGGRWSRDGKTLPGALDIEYNPYGSTCYGLSQAQMGAWISAFVSTYRATTGVSPVIYSTADWYNRCVGKHGDFSSSCPFWIACYCSTVSSLPYNWKYYTIWQHADHGTFPGDQDIFNGSIDRLRALANA